MNDEKKQARFIILNENELDLLSNKPKALILYCYIKLNKNFCDKEIDFYKLGKKIKLKPNQFFTSTRSISNQCKIRRASVKDIAITLRDLGIVELEISPQGYLFTFLVEQKRATPVKRLDSNRTRGRTQNESTGGSKMSPLTGSKTGPQINKQEYNINNKLNNISCCEKDILRESTSAREGTELTTTTTSSQINFISSNESKVEHSSMSENRSDQPPFDLDKKNDDSLSLLQKLDRIDDSAAFKNLTKNWLNFAIERNMNDQKDELIFQKGIYEIVHEKKLCSINELTEVFEAIKNGKNDFWKKRFFNPNCYKEIISKEKSKETLLQGALKNLKFKKEKPKEKKNYWYSDRKSIPTKEYPIYDNVKDAPF